MTKNVDTNKDFISVDKILSYWIFIWVFIYILAGQYQNNILGKFIYDNTNPTYMLYIAFIDNIFVFLTLLYYNPKLNIIIKYLFLIVFIKMIPLELLKNTKINTINNILFSIVFFLIYSFYLLFYGTNFFEIHQRITKSIIQDDKNTPFNYFLSTYVSKDL